VEGTTTSISFVYGVLFPYARQHAGEFLQQHGTSAAVQEILAGLRRQRGTDEQQGLTPPRLNERSLEKPWAPDLNYVHWLMDRDSKATALKALQGLIWEEGYRSGRLKSHVFSDVPEAFKRWRRQSRSIVIFSSGSVLAQKQLFAHTEAGDLSSYIDGYFDTTNGAKRDPDSYRAIARRLLLQTSEIAFISDVTEELDAGSTAGMNTLLCIRPGNRPQRDDVRYASVHSFDEIF
jgi:enolase-phosphatase E1